MKTTLLNLVSSFISLIVIVGCQRDLHNEFAKPTSNSVVQQSAARTVTPTTSSNVADYTITLIEPVKINENYEWVWTIKNNNPGNGKNGTTQDLSHWGMQFGGCFDWTSVVDAAYSSDGIHWITFKPGLGIDPSSCFNEPVFKFDFGTSGSNTSYFRLVINKPCSISENASGYIKSGRNTGCTQINFRGIETCMGS